MSGQSNKLIERYQTDNSALTKGVTYKAEVIDFVQFSLMTCLGDGLAQIFPEGPHRSAAALTGMDIIAYGLMVYLAQLRQEKFNERHQLLSDQHDSGYYTRLARALLDALNDEEKAEFENDLSICSNKIELAKETVHGNTPNEAFIIHLIKYNARLINPKNLPAARSTLDKWNAIFEKAKKRPAFAAYRYQSPIVDQLALVRGKLNHPIRKDKHQSFDELEFDFIFALLKQYSHVLINEKTARYFIGRLRLHEIEENEEAIQAKQVMLFKDYQIREPGLVRHYIDNFYAAYHRLQNANDEAFHRANRRGIQEDELFRTRFKENLFATVKWCSVAGLGYAIGTFVTSLVFLAQGTAPLGLEYIVAPLFLVGATSLVDEVSDLFFKIKKFNQSKKDLEDWKKYHSFLKGVKTQEGIDYRVDVGIVRNEEVYSYYLGAKQENEEYDYKKFARRYLEAKIKERDELTARHQRRTTKLIQACFSFTGVFFGVLISWAVPILAIAKILPGVQDILSLVGFATIGVALAAGLIMVSYQNGQNKNKGTQAEKKLETQTSLLVTKYGAKSREHLLTRAPGLTPTI